MATDVPHAAPTHAELVTELKSLRRPGLIGLRSVELPALRDAAVRCGFCAGPEDAPLGVEELLRKAVRRLGEEGPLGRAALVTFGLAAGTRGNPAQDRRKDAARAYGVSTETFRKHQEVQVIAQVAEAVLALCRAADAAAVRDGVTGAGTPPVAAVPASTPPGSAAPPPGSGTAGPGTPGPTRSGPVMTGPVPPGPGAPGAGPTGPGASGPGTSGFGAPVPRAPSPGHRGPGTPGSTGTDPSGPGVPLSGSSGAGAPGSGPSGSGALVFESSGAGAPGSGSSGPGVPVTGAYRAGGTAGNGRASARDGSAPLPKDDDSPPFQVETTVADAPTPFVLHVSPVDLLRDIDIVVSSENVYLELSKTFWPTVSGALRRAAAVRDAAGELVDDVLARELDAWVRRHGRPGLPVRPGTVAATSSGALAAQGIRRIYHAAVAVPLAGRDGYEVATGDIARAVRETFALARAERDAYDPPLSSLCFPLIGTGRGRVPPEVSARWIGWAVHEELVRDPDWTVHLVIRNRATAASIANLGTARPPAP
ncbi:macro domain-containing protein [Streptomyces sp. DSM 44917]|uniref:Macro domain-containing protein n=1 Tax=Streptomyces boetiae TaxID=3075541 RepID=A0ABU2LCN1_9ACTN|nr:macro domain-containing protein [Streptomyces sp. DSM 44917]MDT0309013.1 macro domain-containing protein [Streptomyces sp. DSM 44917]